MFVPPSLTGQPIDAPADAGRNHLPAPLSELEQMALAIGLRDAAADAGWIRFVPRALRGLLRHPTLPLSRPALEALRGYAHHRDGRNTTAAGNARAALIEHGHDVDHVDQMIARLRAE